MQTGKADDRVPPTPLIVLALVQFAAAVLAIGSRRVDPVEMLNADYGPTAPLARLQISRNSPVRRAQLRHPARRAHFADARAKNDLTAFFDLSKPPRESKPISAPKSENFFSSDKRPATDPDDE